MVYYKVLETAANKSANEKESTNQNKMISMEQQVRPNTRLITSKSVFIITIIVIVLTVIAFWLFGLGESRTIFENSLLSISVLSISFFLFLTIGLYKGIKLKDDLGKITDNLKPAKIPNLADASPPVDFVSVSDDIGGVLIGIVVWIGVTILIGLFLWLFGGLLWAGIIVFIAMLYWIFFRALRLVFKNSNKCKGDLVKSLLYGLGYTILYSFWIYGIILGIHYLNRL